MSEERMGPVGDYRQLQSLLQLLFSALILLVGLQEELPACGNLCHLSTERVEEDN